MNSSVKMSEINEPKRLLRIRKFDEYQHYKDRNPIWIKLYCSILEDYDFSQMSDETKFHAVGLMLLASRLNNKFPADEKWLRQKINANVEINLKHLLEIGFLEFAKEKRIYRKRANSDCKSLKTNVGFASTEEKRKEENKTEHNTTEHGETASGVECVDLENSKFKIQDTEIQDSKFKIQGQPEKNNLKSQFLNLKSQFSIDECFRYVEICRAKGEEVKNAKGLANHLYKTGEADSFIQAALYPEKLAEVEKEKYGEPRQFSDEPCKVCYGAKMANVDGKGFRKCTNCLDEKGRATGLSVIS